MGGGIQDQRCENDRLRKTRLSVINYNWKGKQSRPDRTSIGREFRRGGLEHHMWSMFLLLDIGSFVLIAETHKIDKASSWIHYKPNIEMGEELEGTMSIKVQITLV